MYIRPSVFPSDPGHLATFRLQCTSSRCSQQLKRKAVLELRSYFMIPVNLLFLSQHGRPGRYLFQAAEEFHHHLRPCMGLIFQKIHGQNVFRIYGYLWYHVHHCPYISQILSTSSFSYLPEIHRAWHNFSQARQSVQRSHSHGSISVRSTWW